MQLLRLSPRLGGLVLGLLINPTLALAQDANGSADAATDITLADEPESAATSQPAPPSTRSAATGEATATAAKAEEKPPATEHESAGIIHLLPASAYPEWTVRGIPGGSLAGTFHGVPWPYMPETGVGVSGSIWMDPGYQTLKRGKPGDTNAKFLLAQGRGVLRLTPAYVADGDWYVQGQMELVGNRDQSVARPKNVVDLDDLWIRAGQLEKWDVQVGRFEAFEVYHLGMGLDVNTLERNGATSDNSKNPPDMFELGNVVYRQNGPANLAIHLYPAKFLRLEALGQYGFDLASGNDVVAARPAAVVDFGVVKLKAAGSIRRQFASPESDKSLKTQQGMVAAAQVVLAPYVEAGVNFTYGKIKSWQATDPTNPNAELGAYDKGASTTDSDFGGFLNVRPVDRFVAGVGMNYNQQVDEKGGTFTHRQAFLALQYQAAKSLFFKLVVADAKAHLAPGGEAAWDNTMRSARLRALFLF
jgi:hypothetical protein